MKKILFIIWSYSLGGGAEALLTMIVNHLNPEKYQIGIIEVYHSTVKKELCHSAIKIYEPITFEGDPEYHKKLYYLYKEPGKMTRKYIPSGYDLYVSFNYQYPSFLLPEGARNIAWIHGTVYDLAEEGMCGYHARQCRAFDQAAKIVAISDVTTNSIKTVFPKYTDKLRTIYNALDIRQVREKAEHFTEVVLKHPAIIFVGRLDDNKNPVRMLNIFREAARENHSAHLYFLGKGKLESQILQKAMKEGLQERVHILGYEENPFPIMKQADVFCMTSKSEGFGMALLESIALHVPFVSTEAGIANVLASGGKCGRVYRTDAEAVCHILELLNTPQQSTAEYEEMAKSFDLNAYIAQIENLFDEVLKEKPASECRRIWDAESEEDLLADRHYYYRFPDNLFDENTRVILYGAGNIGTDYYHYIKKSACCQMTAWVDASAERYRKTGKNVKDIAAISELAYDVILIAVMNESLAQAIRMDLCERGVAGEKNFVDKTDILNRPEVV